MDDSDARWPRRPGCHNLWYAAHEAWRVVSVSREDGGHVTTVTGPDRGLVSIDSTTCARPRCLTVVDTADIIVHRWVE